jgi:transposase
MSKNLAERLAMIEPGTLIVGVDLAEKVNEAVFINQQGRRLARYTFSHTREGYELFCKQLSQLQQQEQSPATLVAMEPTSHYWKLLADYLETEKIPYRLVNAYTVKKRREGDQLDWAKDDRRDAFTIADLVRTGKFTETQLLHGDYAELRELSRHYRRLQKDINRQRTLLCIAVGQTFPELRQAFKALTGKTVRAMLKNHSAALHIRQEPEEAFVAAVCQDYDGKQPHRVKLRQAYKLAQRSIALEEVTALQMNVRHCLEVLDCREKQLAEVEDALVTIFQTRPEAPYLQSLGLGSVATALIQAEIGDPSRFRNARQLVKLAGIQPTPNRSGRHQHGKTPMSRKGNPYLRTSLYFSCLRLSRRDPAFKGLYHHYRHRRRHALTKMEAIGALMTKLLHVIWALINQQTFYNPARLYTG